MAQQTTQSGRRDAPTQGRARVLVANVSSGMWTALHTPPSASQVVVRAGHGYFGAMSDQQDPTSDLEARFLDIIRTDALAWSALEAAAAAHASGALPEWRIVSGVLYNAVWNAMDGKPSGYGVKDVDIFYHDSSDPSWEAEDAVIKSAEPFFAELAVPIEIRNQARVHLWYEQKFGRPCPAYRSVEHAIDHFASRAHCVALRLEPDGRLDLYASFGLSEMFERRLVPNRALENPETHHAKAARIKALWPLTIVEPW